MDIARGDDGATVAVGNQLTEAGKVNTLWICEKWSEEAVQFARGKLLRDGVTHLQDGVRKLIQGETWDNLLQAMVPRYYVVPNFIRVSSGVTSEMLRKYVGAPEIIEERYGNLLLNEGIQEMWDLVIAAGGTTAYNNANAEIGTGDSTTAAAATQTDLQAATNKLFKAMVTSYPARTNQTVDFRSDFTSGEGNYAWEEWSVRNGNTRNKNMNRKVQSLGTKTTGTWTLTASITLS